MKASLKWLQEYVDIDMTREPQVLADELTMAGIPVETVEKIGDGVKNIFTGRILSIVPHPNADKLVICKLDMGDDTILTIVTGAKNVKPGQVVPVAIHNAHLPNGAVIKKSKFRGELSEGMLCSAEELGIDDSLLTVDERDGILILPAGTPIGEDCQDVLGLDDVIYEFELTPNRADCFSMVGLSREFAVLTEGEAHFPIIKVTESDRPLGNRLDITVKDKTLCPRYAVRLLENVKIKPSPLWIQKRLRASGIRPINNVVDATNYVMLELGQPMHAYDYDRIRNHHIIVRTAHKDEVLKTLDGSDRVLGASMLVIADEERAIGVAGVMGGYDSEVTEKTTTVLLESAAFKGSNIRKTARMLGMRSEASARFERGINSEFCLDALDRAAQLLQETDSCNVAAGIADMYLTPQPVTKITFTADEINAYLGTNVSEKRMISILETLKFKVESVNRQLVATVPSWRGDCTMMADISEEIARIYGYDNIVTTTPWSAIISGKERPENLVSEIVSSTLTNAGLFETVTFSFMNNTSLEKLNFPKGDRRYMAIPIRNPISEEFPFMRTSLLPSLLDVIDRNQAVKNMDVAIYEIAAVYLPEALPLTKLPQEKKKVAGLLCGMSGDNKWPNKKRPYDFYDVKGLMVQVMQNLGIDDVELRKTEYAPLHPGKSAQYCKDGKTLCTFGEINPAVIVNYDLIGPMYLFEMDLSTLISFANLTGSYQKIAKFPSITRDLAIQAPAAVSNEDIMTIMHDHGGSYLETVHLFDVYQGKQISDGFKSMAYTLSFRSAEGTLTDADIEGNIKIIVATLKESLQCSLR